MANWQFNADANMGHRFAIFMAHVGALRASHSGARLTWALGLTIDMHVDEKFEANERQIRTYFTHYDRFWRLNKLILLKEMLLSRPNIQSKLEGYHGVDFFDYECLVYQNITNGILADAISEVAMYCEDYLGFLKFIREKTFFIKHTVSYSAGTVKNIASRLRTISKEQTHRLFFIPPEDLVAITLARQNAATANSELKKFSGAVHQIKLAHEDVIRFFERHKDAHNQYKHGLKLCLNGLGGRPTSEELMRRKSEHSASLFILQNKTAHEAAKAGGLMIPDISSNAINNNLMHLFNDRNLLHIETLYHVDIDMMISMARKISTLISTLVANRIHLDENKGRRTISICMPSNNESKLVSNNYVIKLFNDQKMPTIDDYQIKL